MQKGCLIQDVFEFVPEEWWWSCRFYKSHVQVHHMQYIQGVTDLDFLVLKVTAPSQVPIAVIYRPSDSKTNIFAKSNLFDSLHVIADCPVIVCGDFNEDLLASGRKMIFELVQSSVFRHLIITFTTENCCSTAPCILQLSQLHVLHSITNTSANLHC